MPRGLPQAAIDALAGDQANTAVLVEIDAATVNGDSPLAAPIRLTNRPGGSPTPSPRRMRFTPPTARCGC